MPPTIADEESFDIKNSGNLPSELAEPLGLAEMLDTPVFLNGKEVGSGYILLFISTGAVRVFYPSLSSLLHTHLSDFSYESLSKFLVLRCDIETNAFEPFSSEVTGISIFYNESLQRIEMSIAAPHLRELTTQIRSSHPFYSEGTVVPPANWSGYLNVLYGRRMTQTFSPSFQMSQSPKLCSADLVVHHANWTLEGSGNLNDKADTGQWFSRKNALFSYDMPQKRMRLGIGDIFSPVLGFQRAIPVLGLSINHNANLFGVQRAAPLTQYSFLLMESSRVEVMINDNVIKTLDLPAGAHSINDFPLAFGSNMFTLRVTDSSGREETMHMDYIYDTSSLPKKEIQYASSLGIPQNYINSGYIWNRLLYSGYCLYGVSSLWTIGGYAQIDRRLAQLGYQNLLVSKRVKTDFTLGTAWYFGSLPQLRSRLTFENTPRRGKRPIALRGSIEYFGQPDGAAPQREDDLSYLNWKSPMRLVTALSASGKTLFACSGSIGGRYIWLQEGTGYSLSASLSRNFYSSLSCNLTGYHTSKKLTREAPDTGVVISLRWSPAKSRFSTQSTYNSSWSTFDQTVNFSDQKKGSAIRANGGVRIQPNGHYKAVGTFDYQGERMTGTVSNEFISQYNRNSQTPMQGLTSFSIGSCIAFADGVFAISRPIPDSFVIVAANKEISRFPVRVNPSSEDNYMGRTYGRIPSVLSNVSSYHPTRVSVESPTLPMGYELGAASYTCLPSYKSGTLIRVGEEGGAFVIGKCLLDKEVPFRLSVGTLKNHKGEEIPFFTNREGEFQIESLKAGTYSLFIGSKGPFATFKVPKDSVPGFFDAGTLHLKKP